MCPNSAWFQKIYGAKKYIIKNEMHIYGTLEVG